MKPAVTRAYQEAELRALKLYSDKNTTALEQQQENLYRQELSLIEHNELKCPLDQQTERTLTDPELKKFYRRGQDANIAKAITCQNTFLTYTPNQFLRTHLLLGDLQVIGSGVEGVTMRSGNVRQPRFIVKSSQDSESEQLVHEYFVGAFGTNNLRNEIPNFSAVLGYFRCSGTFISDSQVLSYCASSENPVNYILYEPVKGVSLETFILEHDFDEILQVLTGLILALQVAYERIDFTHYDLHPGNVMVRELPEEIAIPYRMNKQTYYLHTRYIPTLIDYGRAHIKYNGQDYGYEMIQYGVFPDRSFPMYDIYKVIMDTIYYLLRDHTNKALVPRDALGVTRTSRLDSFQELSKIIFFFNPTLGKTLRDRYNYTMDVLQSYAILPYKAETNISPLEFFNKAWLPNFGGYLLERLKTRPITPVVYGCTSNNSCLTLQLGVQDYTVDVKELFGDVLHFYDAVTLNKGKETQMLLEGNPYQQNYFLQIINLKQKTLNMIRPVLLVSLRTSVRPEDRVKEPFLSNYTRFIRDVVHNLNVSNHYHHYHEIYLYLADHYPLPHDIEQRNNFLDSQFETMIPGLKASSESVREDAEQLRKEGNIPKPLQELLKFSSTSLVFDSTPVPMDTTSPMKVGTSYSQASSFEGSPMTDSIGSAPVAPSTPYLSRLLAQLKI